MFIPARSTAIARRSSVGSSSFYRPNIYSEFYVDHNLPPIAPTSDEHIELVYQSLRQKIPELLHVLKTPKAEYQALINPQAFVVGGRNHVISLDQAARGKLWEKLKDRSLQISKEIDSTSALISVATDYLEKGVVIGFTVIFSNAPLLLKLIMLLSPIWIGVDLYFQMKKHRVQFENQDSVAASSTLEKAIVNQKQAYHKLWNVLIYISVVLIYELVTMCIKYYRDQNDVMEAILFGIKASVKDTLKLVLSWEFFLG